MVIAVIQLVTTQVRVLFWNTVVLAQQLLPKKSFFSMGVESRFYGAQKEAYKVFIDAVMALPISPPIDSSSSKQCSQPLKSCT